MAGSREKRGGERREGQQAKLVDAVSSPPTYDNPLYGRVFLPRTTEEFRDLRDTLSPA